MREISVSLREKSSSSMFRALALVEMSCRCPPAFGNLLRNQPVEQVRIDILDVELPLAVVEARLLHRSSLLCHVVPGSQEVNRINLLVEQRSDRELVVAATTTASGDR